MGGYSFTQLFGQLYIQVTDQWRTQPADRMASLVILAFGDKMEVAISRTRNQIRRMGYGVHSGKWLIGVLSYLMGLCCARLFPSIPYRPFIDILGLAICPAYTVYSLALTFESVFALFSRFTLIPPARVARFFIIPFIYTQHLRYLCPLSAVFFCLLLPVYYWTIAYHLLSACLTREMALRSQLLCVQIT